jgi:hypothetical protein
MQAVILSRSGTSSPHSRAGPENSAVSGRAIVEGGEGKRVQPSDARGLYGRHFTGVTARGVPLSALTQPCAVRRHG